MMTGVSIYLSKIVTMRADAKSVASKGATRKYVVKMAKAMGRVFKPSVQGAAFHNAATCAVKAAKSKFKMESFVKQVKVKDEMIGKLQVQLKVDNNKLFMYRKSDVLSQQLMSQYQHSSTQEVLSTKFRTKLVRGSRSVVNARTKVKEVEIARMVSTLDKLEAKYSPAKHSQSE